MEEQWSKSTILYLDIHNKNQFIDKTIDIYAVYYNCFYYLICLISFKYLNVLYFKHIHLIYSKEIILL